MSWIVAAGAAAVPFAAAGLWLSLARREHEPLGEPEGVLAAAEAALPGFRGLAVVIAPDRRTALASGEGDRLALLRARRAAPTVREIAWPAVRATPGGVLVEPDGRWTRAVAIHGIDALDVRRLAPERVREE